MRNKKRILALALAMTMISSSIVWATEYTATITTTGPGANVSPSSNQGPWQTNNGGGDYVTSSKPNISGSVTDNNNNNNGNNIITGIGPGGGTNNNNNNNNNIIIGGSPGGNNNTNANAGTSPSNPIIAYTPNYIANGALKAPSVLSEGAMLINATNGTVIFEKNGYTKYYPASITKLMTALLVLENSSLDDIVTFSNTAVTNLEAGSVTLNLTAGDRLTVRDSLYGLLLKSANEVANGLAEHVAGSIPNFTARMNERAKALGCQNTNFTNANGLNGENHYSTPYDMALIAKEAFNNSTLRQISSTMSYTFPATLKVNTTRTLTPGHKMLYNNDTRYYPGMIGGKTGYTSKAGNTLVTCVERNGVRLISVVMKASQSHYEDTKAMLDYGFQYVAAQNTNTNANNAINGKWMQDNTGWYFVKSDGNFVKDCWMNIDGKIYLFESTGYMAQGWKQMTNGTWYYFGNSGSMKKSGWVETNNSWYYLNENGTLFTNGTTPDGYKVNEYGIWIQ